jgi:hypothetical protein
MIIRMSGSGKDAKAWKAMLSGLRVEVGTLFVGFTLRMTAG